MFYRYLIKISLCHVVSKLSPLLRLILLWSVRRTVRYSSASTTAPPSSPIWFTWWSFTSLTEECCPASSNTHAPLWPCDTPPPQTFLCTPLSLRSPSLPFCPLYPFPYQRSGGWGDGEKLHPVLRMWTTLLGARTGSRCPPVGNGQVSKTVDSCGCFVIGVQTPEKDQRDVKPQDGYSMFPVGLLDGSLPLESQTFQPHPPTFPILQAW